MRKYLMTGAATAALIFGLSQAMAQQKPETGGNAPAAATGAPSGGASADQKKMGQELKGDQKKTVGQAQDNKADQKLGQKPDVKSDQKMGQGADQKKTIGQAPDKADQKLGQKPDQKLGQGTDQKMGQQKSTVGQSKDSMSKDSMSKDSSPKTGTQPSTQSSQGTQSGSQSTTAQGKQAPSGTSSQTGTSTSQSTQTGTSSQTTTGAAPSGTVQLNEQQRTEIRQTVLTSNAPRVNNVNFSISVGTVVPRTVHVVAVPEPLIRIHPEWRRHKFFVVNDEIIIVDDSFRIIAVLQV